MNHPVTFIFLSSLIGNVFIFNSDSETEFVWGSWGAMMVEKAQRSASCVNWRGGSVERTDWRRRYCVMITSFIGIFASGAATLHFGWFGSQYFMKLSILFASILIKRKKFGRRCEQLSASLVCAGVEINLNFCAISLLALKNFNKFASCGRAGDASIWRFSSADRHETHELN